MNRTFYILPGTAEDQAYWKKQQRRWPQQQWQVATLEEVKEFLTTDAKACAVCFPFCTCNPSATLARALGDQFPDAVLILPGPQDDLSHVLLVVPTHFSAQPFATILARET